MEFIAELDRPSVVRRKCAILRANKRPCRAKKPGNAVFTRGGFVRFSSQGGSLNLLPRRRPASHLRLCADSWSAFVLDESFVCGVTCAHAGDIKINVQVILAPCRNEDALLNFEPS